MGSPKQTCAAVSSWAQPTITLCITYACELLASRTPTLIYLYWGELDQAGHRYGAGSDEWLEQLEELNLALRRLAERSPAWAGIFLTADHGMVIVPQENRHRLFGDQRTSGNVAMTAGGTASGAALSA